MITTLSDHLVLLAKLMELHNENPFKIKAINKVVDIVEAYPESFNSTKIEDVIHIKGVGDSIAQIIVEFNQKNTSTALDKYLSTTPSGVIEMLFSIRGIGAKKLNVLWLDHHIDTIDKLLEACNHNKLKDIKGFGEVQQEKIKDRILFYLQYKDYRLYHHAKQMAKQILVSLIALYEDNVHNIITTGDIRRQLPTVRCIEFLTDIDADKLKQTLLTLDWDVLSFDNAQLTVFHQRWRKVIFHFASQQEWGSAIVKTSSAKAFLKTVDNSIIASTEKEFFSLQQLPFVPAYLREYECQELKDIDPTIHVIDHSDIKGVIHCHSNWSDGANPIEEMAQHCIDKGFEYLVLTDHSKSSYVANGLTEERVLLQHQLIDDLNKKLYPFKIFKSIECDILNDGALDYSDDILKLFDIVIASVHNNLDMDKATATQRILKAIENPYTNIMGHISGRLLLNRQGYDLDYDAILQACLKHNVVIEINSNPHRLDIDWIYLKKIINMGIKVSINPDAHHINDIRFINNGIYVAQKGNVQKIHNLSSLSKIEFEIYCAQLKK